MPTRSRSASWLPLALALSASCVAGSPPAQGPDAGSAAVTSRLEQGDAGTAGSLIIVLPDAGPDAIAAAERAVQASHPQAQVRVGLIADLNAPDLLGIAPGAPAAMLDQKLGPTAEKRGDIWRWPALGVQAVVRAGAVQRLALHARARPDDPEMKIFVGEVLVGTEPLTRRAPDLTIKQVVLALGTAGARGEAGPEVTEMCWRRGSSSSLYLTFDNLSQTLEAIVLEPFDAKLWAAMKPLEKNPRLWDLSPGSAIPPQDGTIAFAQMPEATKADDVARMRLIAGGLPDAKVLFSHLEARFLEKGGQLRRLDGQRAAMLRSDGCTYLVVERGDGTWDARNPNVPCELEREPEGLLRLRRIFARAK